MDAGALAQLSGEALRELLARPSYNLAPRKFSRVATVTVVPVLLSAKEMVFLHCTRGHVTFLNFFFFFCTLHVQVQL